MGYFARGNGSITFKEILSKEKFEEIKDLLDETFEADGIESFKNLRSGKLTTYFDIWGNEKYHGDAVENTLNAVAAAAPIEEGEIHYCGEDEFLWRFIFKDGEWLEENGEINYSGIDTDKLLSALRNYVLHDLEAKDPSFVLETLINVCGLTDNDLQTIGLGDLTAK